MEQSQNEIKIAYIDPGVNAILSSIGPEAVNYPLSMHFNQNEEYFVKVARDLIVPHLPIHHDVRVPTPSASYSYSVSDVVRQLVAMLPGCFRGLTYFFDPSEISKLCFYRLYKVEEQVYLYLLRLDLFPRPSGSEILEPGTNDITPAYSTRSIFIESELIPLEAVMWETGRARAFRIRQLVSQTWIGETGKGYHVRGIWIDTGLSKFFTKLFMPAGHRLYPYYPFFCKYRTICAMAPVLENEARRKLLPTFHQALRFLEPELEPIQQALRKADFSETLPEFAGMRDRVPARLRTPFERFRVEAYLNEKEQKEFRLAYAIDQA